MMLSFTGADNSTMEEIDKSIERDLTDALNAIKRLDIPDEE